MTPFERLAAWLAKQPGVRDVKASQTIGGVWIVWLRPGPIVRGDLYAGRGATLDEAIDDALRDAGADATSRAEGERRG